MERHDESTDMDPIATFFNGFPILQSNQRLKEAVGQAIYFIVKNVPTRLSLSSNYRYKELSWSTLDETQFSHRNAIPSAFPDAKIRIELAKRLLGDTLPLTYMDDDPDQILRPDKLKGLVSGGCKSCVAFTMVRGVQREKGLLGFGGGNCPCRINEFLEEIGSLGTDLLVLSLLGDASNLDGFPMVKGGPLYDPNPWHRPLYTVGRRSTLRNRSLLTLITSGWQILMHGRCKLLISDTFAIFKHAAMLLNHQAISESTILSSGSGQVLIPAFWEWNSFHRSGYFQLSAFAGELRWNGMNFDALIDSFSHELRNAPVSDSEEESESEDDEHAVVSESSEVGSGLDEEMEVDSNGNNDEVATEGLEEMDAENPEDPGDSIDDPESELEEHLESDFVDLHLPEDFQPDPRPQIGHRTIEWSLSVVGSELFGELKPPGSSRILAWSLFDALHRSIISPPCHHKVNNPAGDLGFPFMSVKSTGMIMEQARKTLILAHRKYQDQLVALEAQSEEHCCVVHQDGCIYCALKICLDLDCLAVIS
jgi:hypothetical protein